jgi:sedoheptulokinase
MHALGLDIGTTSIKASVYDLENWEAVESLQETTGRLPDDDPYAYTQDPDLIWDAVVRMLSRLRTPYDMIGVTGQVHGILYYDAYGNAVSPLYTWLDRRALRPVAGGTYQDVLFEKTGMNIACGYGMLTHFTLHSRAGVPQQAAGFTGILEYITSKLAPDADLGSSDASVCASYGGFDPVENRFDRRLVGVLSQTGELVYPKAAAPFSIAGSTDTGIPVSYAVGDNQAGFFAAVRRPESEALISIGTSGQLSVYSQSSDIPDTMELRPYFGLGYLHVGATLTAGKAYEEIKELAKDVLILAGVEHVDDNKIYEMMRNAAGGCIGQDRLFMRTTFNGTRSDPDRMGTIDHIGIGDLRLGSLAAAAVKGAVKELYLYAQCLGALFDPIARIIGVGNSLLHNGLYTDVLESVFEREVVLSGASAAQGAAMICSVASNILRIEDVHQISESAGQCTRYGSIIEEKHDQEGE